MTAQEREKRRAEEQQRQNFPASDGTKTESRDRQNERASPDHVGEPEERSTLEEDARPFTLGKKEGAAADEEFRAGIRSHS